MMTYDPPKAGTGKPPSIYQISPGEKPVLESISIVIPTLGRDILEQCLSWIASGSAWPACLVIVNQGPREKTEAWLAHLRSLGLRTRHVPSSQHGRSAGINRGLERVDTRFVAITDDDCFVTADWLEKMENRLQREPGTIFTGRVDHAGEESVPFSVVTSHDLKRYERPTLKDHPFIGGNVGMAMEVVRRVGLFDEHPCLQAAEDSDYGYRALRLGIPIVYDPEIVLQHYHWRDAAQRASRYADYARSQGGFYGTHLRWGNWIIWQQAVRGLIRGPLRWLRGALRRDGDMVDRGRADSLNLLPGILAGVRRQLSEDQQYNRISKQ